MVRQSDCPQLFHRPDFGACVPDLAASQLQQGGLMAASRQVQLACATFSYFSSSCFSTHKDQIASLTTAKFRANTTRCTLRAHVDVDRSYNGRC